MYSFLYRIQLLKLIVNFKIKVKVVLIMSATESSEITINKWFQYKSFYFSV